MNTRTYTIIGTVGVAAAIVTAVIFSLQNFDAEKVSCDGISEARASLQAAYDTGVSAGVQVFAEEKANIDEQLHQCLNAKPADPCADAQKARDAAANNYLNGTPSPADNAPYAEFKLYFDKRDKDYASYKKAKDALDQCRAANPPKGDVLYEKSDTKACFDAYDAATESARNTFDHNTNTMRAALKAAFASLDAREKACHPPTGSDKFTEPPKTAGGTDGGSVPVELVNCKPINLASDTELSALQQRAAALPGEIQAAQTSIDNINKRMSPLQRSLSEVDTYIPPESTRTQFEGTLNALRAERKVAIESSLDFYKNMLTKRQAEKAALDQELRDVQAKIAARIALINKENQARQRNFPTALHQAKPDKCAYYHCHGMLCGKPDPDPHGCGQGSTSESDVDCKQFIDAYLKAAATH